MIEVGEYVRLKNGEIFKIDENTANYYNSNKEFITNEIVKHSKNLIDLIEVGDYVNGEKVVGRGNNCILILTDEGQTFLRNIFEDNDIKSIVTKEQMKSVEYIVGDSNEDS